MSETHTRQLEKLAEDLVTEERYGKVALAPVIQLRLLPETVRIYDFPDMPGAGV